ncbi:MAG TPA: transglutaminase domain-containing protein [Pirellulales bacterium]|nr:transglutaminase domain-containing protein [Pirellulales bacterium]
MIVVLALATVLPAQFGEDATKGPRPDPEREVVERWQIGLVVTAASGPCEGIVGTFTLPVDWPEQEVSIVAEDYSPFVASHDERMIGAAKQLVLVIPELPAGEEARAVLTVEIRRRALLPPADTSIFVKVDSKKLHKDIRTYLGPSPKIESQSGKIKALAKDLGKKSGGQSAWEQVEMIYRWVRDNVKSEDVDSQGAALALKARTGGHEDLTALFIALCRASGIPARTVWQPKFCYPEFYLEDADGTGYWFPCQMVGEAVIGGMPDYRPIWQKGDNFRAPNRPRAERYIPPTLEGKGGNPEVKFIRDAQAMP